VTVTVPAGTTTYGGTTYPGTTAGTVYSPIAVSTPTNVPLDAVKPVYLLSHEYKIEDIEGQCVRDWFKNDFGANNTFEFQAKLKASAGRAKAKVILDPTDRQNIKVTEDLEIQANIDYGVSGLFKVRPKEVSAQFDFGIRPLSRYWANPYVVFRLPRAGGNCKSAGTVGLGGVFHADRLFNQRYRHQAELGVGFGSDKSDIVLRQNLSLWYRNFIAGLYLGWNFTNGFTSETKISGAYSEGPVRAYTQLDLGDRFGFRNLGFGASYKVRPDFKVFVQTSKPFVAKTEGSTVSTEAPRGNFLNNVDLGAGVEFSHRSGLAVKLGYFHDKKVASVLSFNLNKYFSGSLLLDKFVSADKKSDYAWGAILKFSS